MAQTGRGLVPALLLAAGLSARFGANKLLMPLGGKAVIDCPLGALIAAGVSPIYIVLGHEAEAVQAHCRPYAHRVHFVENPDYPAGRASSVQAGLKAIESDALGVLITPADVPLIGCGLLAALLAQFQQSGLLTFPLTPAGRGHPVIFPRSEFHRLEALRGEATLHSYITSGTAPVSAVNWNDTGCTMDIDTPEDLERLEVQVAQRQY